MTYDYLMHVDAQVDRMVRAFFAKGTRIERTGRPVDLAGADYIFCVNQHCPIAVRCRFDRPHMASQTDITWRTTEPAKIKAGTYAPIAFFFWFQQYTLVAGRGIDVYRMQSHIDWTLYTAINNGDGTAFLPVTIPELRAWRALLRSCDREHWITEAEAMDADRRILSILKDWESPRG
jgi:hypothetical protein